MSNARWQRVQDLYHAALERPMRERAQFLREACAGDAALLHEVQSLLDQPISAEQFLVAGEPRLDDTSSVRVGERLGVYQIQAFIGRGGMGEVYLAQDTRLGREVALKVLPGLFALDLGRLARFKREAQVLASLNHPNIAAIYGFEESTAVQALVLELVDGEILGGPVPVDTALDYAGQVAEALEAAHSKGIIHRDLKPANVKVTSQGKVKLLDFGLAKAVLGVEPRQGLSQPPSATGTKGGTVAGLIVGSPSYMSPEQVRGHDVNERTDIWAFGCLLYELLTGRQAFPGTTLADTLATVLEREPDWKALPDATPLRVRELLRRCLDKERGPAPADYRGRSENNRAGTAWMEPLAGRGDSGSRDWDAGPGRCYLVAWHGRVPQRSEWIQITKFPDSVSQPALSPDGRMVTFIRGPRYLLGGRPDLRKGASRRRTRAVDAG